MAFFDFIHVDMKSTEIMIDANEHLFFTKISVHLVDVNAYNRNIYITLLKQSFVIRFNLESKGM